MPQSILQKRPLKTRWGGTGNGGTLSGMVVADGRNAFTSCKINFFGSAAPGVGDDTNDGYSVGSQWFDLTGDVKYDCLDATVGAAVWKSSSGTGEVNTGANVGTGGVGLFKQKSGVTLQFRNINAGSSKITVTLDAGNNEVDLDITEANLTLQNQGGVLTAVKGGTGASVYAIGDMLVADSTTTVAKLTIGGSGTILTSDGTTASWEAPGAPPAHTHDGTDIVGPQPVAASVGGTGMAGGYVLGGLLAASGPSALQEVAPNTTITQKFLSMTGNGVAGAIPTWEVVSGVGGTVDTVVGTAGRITVNSTDPVNPIVDISTSYVGQATITTLGTITTGTWSATAVAANKGGTGQTSYTTGDLPYASGASAISKLAIGTTGQALTVSGGLPAWGTLPVAGGGLGLTTVAAGELPYGSGVNTYGKVSVGSNGDILTLSGGLPVWAAAPSGGTVDTVVGTANKIDIDATDPANPIATISPTYVGQTSIVTLGTVGTGTWSASTIAVNKGGTGQTSYTDGQILIGNSAGNTLTKATLTAGTNITITNAGGSITIDAATGGGGAINDAQNVGTGDGWFKTISGGDTLDFKSVLGTANQVVVTSNANDLTLSLPQSIHTAATPTFGAVTLSSAAPIILTSDVPVLKTGMTATDESDFFKITGNADDVLFTLARTGSGAAKLTVNTVVANVTGNLTGNITGTAPAGTLTGTTLAATVVTSSLTAVGTIATGVWNGTAVTVPFGGTGAASFTDAGVLLGNGTGAVQVTTAGTAGQVLTSNGAGVDPSFQAAPAGGNPEPLKPYMYQNLVMVL